jgi:hypothetical protein
VRAALLLTLVALAGCGSSDGGTASFDEDGFDITFEYPEELDEAKNVTIESDAGSSARATAGLGFSKNDVIIVQRYDLKLAVDDDNLDQAKGELDLLIRQISPGAGPGKTGETRGFPSVEYDDVRTRTIEGGRSRLVALFDGEVEYLINCQSTPDRREDIKEACAQVLKTVEKK